MPSDANLKPRRPPSLGSGAKGGSSTLPVNQRGTKSSNPLSSSGESAANLTSSIRRQSRSVVSLAGTEGSNPSPSSAESGANLTSRPGRHEGIELGIMDGRHPPVLSPLTTAG